MTFTRHSSLSSNDGLVGLCSELFKDRYRAASVDRAFAEVLV